MILMSGKPELLIVSEPLNGLESVQHKFIFSFARSMQHQFNVTIASMKVSNNLRSAFELSNMRVIAPSNDVFSIGKVLSKFSLDNESTLWAEAWLREVFLFQNSGYITKIADSKKFDYVINTTNTIPIKCDLWWIQGVSASTAMESMAFRKNWQRAFARMIELGLRTPSINIINRLNSKSDLRVANSNYIKNYYHNIGIAVDGVVHSFPDVSSFKKEDTRTGEKYVFGYVGKETEVDTLLRLTGENIKLITFGREDLNNIRT